MGSSSRWSSTAEPGCRPLRNWNSPRGRTSLPGPGLPPPPLHLARSGAGSQGPEPSGAKLRSSVRVSGAASLLSAARSHARAPGRSDARRSRPSRRTTAGNGVSPGRVPCALASPLRPSASHYIGIRVEARLTPCRPVPRQPLGPRLPCPARSPAGSAEPLCPGRAHRAAERRPVPRLARLSVAGLQAAASCRAGEQARTERESVRQPGKGKCQAPGCGAECSSPLPGFIPGSAAREANTAFPLLPRHRRPGPGRSLSRTRCEPGPHRAGAALPAPSSADPRAPDHGSEHWRKK
ncbi:uncharacterized protein LOC128792643 [Vidua chalybeata]|uniref:uncharacterized protein LOC128792643 n=1 Tax=Vidua chalybeata TaxID=81927 RepID=UPI0023A7FCEE|nr:uncharacterized protein LOC128792643 [Vidua chalybeata]